MNGNGSERSAMSAPHTVCLLGLGEVGSILADDLLAQTDVRIAVWDRLLAVAGRDTADKAGCC